MKRIILTLTLALFIAPITIAQDLPSHIPTDGLVAYYPFNGNANDASGNGHHGTVNGATLTTDLNDYSDKAYAFSHDSASFGDNHQSIYIPFHSDFQSETFTIGVWFKADSYGWDGNSKIESTLISKRENSNDINQATYRIQLSSSFTRSEIGSNTGSDEIPCTIDTNPINLDAWYHAASTYDGVTLRQYINGVKTSELVCDLGHNAVSTSGIMLGQTWQYNGYWYHLDGKLDEFMVYNRALSGVEMENYYVSATSDILLNGTVSAENNQIKNVADPTDAQDAATKGFIEGLLSDYQSQIDDLQDQIDALQASSGSGTVNDQDGNSYPYLTYGGQVWTVKNAEVVTYRDGTVIPQVTDATEWSNLTTGAWCYYGNDSSKGKLYNWYAVMGIHDNDENTPNKELAPKGWHVPSDDEWTELENYLIDNGYNYDGTTAGSKIAKAMASKTGWNSSNNTGAIGNNQSLNNSSGFNAFPEGDRNGDGSFDDEGFDSDFWSSTEIDVNTAWYRDLNSNDSFLYTGTWGKQSGFSARFVRD